MLIKRKKNSGGAMRGASHALERADSSGPAVWLAPFVLFF